MKFKIDFPIPRREIIHDFQRVFLIGSCFSTIQHSNFRAEGFDSLANPFGIQYNPYGLAKILSRIAGMINYEAGDFINNGSEYFSLEHHGDMRSANLEEAVRHSNSLLLQCSQFIKNTQLVVVTLGTSLVFRHLERDEIVSNCHKLPSSAFEQYFLSDDEVLSAMSSISFSLQQLNSKSRIVWTISPVRHLKSGVEQNFISKSILRSCLHQHIDSNPEQFYFPAYEIFVDELRDYRFSSEDMAHPTKQASDYIWQRFRESFCSLAMIRKMDEVRKFRQFEAHRPRNEESFHKQRVKEMKNKLLEKYEHIYL